MQLVEKRLGAGGWGKGWERCHIQQLGLSKAAKMNASSLVLSAQLSKQRFARMTSGSLIAGGLLALQELGALAGITSKMQRLCWRCTCASQHFAVPQRAVRCTDCGKLAVLMRAQQLQGQHRKPRAVPETTLLWRPAQLPTSVVVVTASILLLKDVNFFGK